MNKRTPQEQGRKCERIKQEVKRDSKRSFILIDPQVYEQIVEDAKAFRLYLDAC